MCQHVNEPPLDEQSPLFTAFDAPILRRGLWFENRPFVMSQSVPLAGLMSGLHSALCDAEPEAAAPVSVNEEVMSTLQGNQRARVNECVNERVNANLQSSVGH